MLSRNGMQQENLVLILIKVLIGRKELSSGNLTKIKRL